MKKNLVLIGMMGSGKSTIGRILSKKIKLNFFDIDKLIEQKTDLSISEIFKRKGEDFFREIEEKTTLKYLKSSNNIIALGGGAFLNNNIRAALKTNSISIWLNWSSKLLIPRISKNKTRPKASELSKNELVELINERSKIYSMADYEINCDKLNKNEIVKKILKIYED